MRIVAATIILLAIAISTYAVPTAKRMYKIGLYKSRLPPNFKRNFDTWRQPDLVKRLSNADTTDNAPFRRAIEPTVVDDVLREGYCGQINVGSKHQPVNVLFHTATTDVWFLDSDCTGTGCPKGPTFDYTTSKTFYTENNPFDAKSILNSTGDSEAIGVLAMDQIAIDDDVVVAKQNFGIIDKTVGNPSANCTGVVGLGVAQQSQNGVTPFFVELLRANALYNPVFSVMLGRGDPEKGSVTIGGIDGHYARNIHYFPANAFAFPLWEVNVGNLDAGGNNAGYNRRAQFDSSSPFITIPTDDAQEMGKYIPIQPYKTDIQGTYSIKCDNDQALEIGFGLDENKKYKIDLQDLILYRISDNLCLSTILAPTLSTPWILGAPFFRSVYTVFNFEKRTVGLAQLI